MDIFLAALKKAKQRDSRALSPSSDLPLLRYAQAVDGHSTLAKSKRTGRCTSTI
jgi:hypothetical protein